MLRKNFIWITKSEKMYEFLKRGKSNIRNHKSLRILPKSNESWVAFFAPRMREVGKMISTEKDSDQFVRILRSPRMSTGKKRRWRGDFFSIWYFDILIGAVSIFSMTQSIHYFDTNWGLMIEIPTNIVLNSCTFFITFIKIFYVYNILTN